MIFGVTGANMFIGWRRHHRLSLFTRSAASVWKDIAISAGVPAASLNIAWDHVSAAERIFANVCRERLWKTSEGVEKQTSMARCGLEDA